MKKNILYISPMQARALALEAANVRSARFDSQKLLEGGSLYELEFTTEEMQMCIRDRARACPGSSRVLHRLSSARRRAP